MAEIIEDGTGSGRKAKVDEDNQLAIRGITQNEGEEANEVHSKSYTLDVDSKAVTGADDCFVYIKNTDDEDLVIDEYCLWQDSGASELEVKVGDAGTPSGGGSVTPTNMKSGSGKSATGIFETGSDITNLSGGSIVLRTICGPEASAFPQNSLVRPYSGIVVPKNKTCTFYHTAGGKTVRGYIAFHYST